MDGDEITKCIKQREYKYDNLKGIMILLVVAGHMTTIFSNRQSLNIIMSFNVVVNVLHMPVFCFISGYFASKHMDDKSIYKVVNDILIPFVVFNLLHWLFESRAVSTLLTPQFTMWYLLSLFFWRMLIVPLGAINYIFPISILLSLLIGLTELDGILSIVRTVCYFPFFVMGYKCTPETVGKIRSKIRGYLFIPFVCLIIIVGAVILLRKEGIPDENFYMRESYISYGFASLQGVCFRIVSITLSCVGIMCALVLSPERHIPMITTFGRNSITIYLGHSFVVKILQIARFAGNNFVALLRACSVFIEKYIIIAHNYVKEQKLSETDLSQRYYKRAIRFNQRLFS